MTEDSRKWGALALMAITLVLSMSTWFSASAVIPQLQEHWELSAGQASWPTIAVQIGFVCGARARAWDLGWSDRSRKRHASLDQRPGWLGLPTR